MRSFVGPSILVTVAALLGLARAQDSPNVGQREPSSKELMAPASEHPGKPLKIPEPEKDHSTAIGRPPESDLSLPANGRAAVVGTVVSVSHAPESIAVKDEKGDERQLLLTAKTRFIRNRRAIRRSAIKPGSEVHVAYRYKANRLLAERIELLQQPSARKKAQAAQSR